VPGTGLTSWGALPALEMLVSYSGQRQRILAHNVANWQTPDFRPADVAPAEFQKVLGEAVARRRASGGLGDLAWRPARGIERGPGGVLRLRPVTPLAEGPLRHDRNDVDLERLMQDMTENLAVFRTATDLLRTRQALMHAAISERV